MKLTLDLPMTRAQRWGTAVFCAGADALFLAPSVVAEWADVSPSMVLAAVAVWPGALVFWLVKSLVDDNDNKKAYQDGSAEERYIEALERQQVRPQPHRRPRSTVIDGEVLQ